MIEHSREVEHRIGVGFRRAWRRWRRADNLRPMTSRLRPRATLVLFASLLLSSLGCPSDDTPSDAETGTETETGTGDGDGDPGDGDGDPGTCSTPGVYGDCAGGLDACMTDGPKQCVLDSQNMPSIAVCGRPCADVCDCWEAPAGSEAAPASASPACCRSR